jgi:hypothetical protein
LKFYITIEDIEKLRKSFLNLKLFSIIYVPEILENLGYSYDTINEYGIFIVNKKINHLIKTYSRSKRTRGIIYSNPSLTKDILPNLFDFLEETKNISEVVLIDEYNVPKVKSLYEHFNEIIFFPSIKKIRLIECQSFR